jgi:hypothetical protein
MSTVHNQNSTPVEPIMVVVVTEMAFAAYLVGVGQKISQIHRKGRKVSWEFEIPPEELSRLEVVWPSSAECRFFNAYQTLKGHLKFS